MLQSDVCVAGTAKPRAAGGKSRRAGKEPKMTSMKEQTFGVEVEMVCSRKLAAQTVAAYFGTEAEYTGGAYKAWRVPDTEGRRWTLERDASIAAPDDDRCEFVTPICTWKDIETVQNLIRKLRENGARAHSSCGIHVHIGAGEHTPKTLRNLVNIVNAHEDLLTQSLQISPERRTQWCKEVDQSFLERLNRQKPRTSEALARLWYNDTDWRFHTQYHYDGSRYHLLNLHAYWTKGTVEFRAFNATMHAGEIKAYIQLCMAIS